MNILFIAPENLRVNAVHLLAVLTGDVSNLGAMGTMAHTDGVCNYSVVCIPAIYVNLDLLSAPLVRPVSDSLEVIDMVKAEMARIDVESEFVADDVITIAQVTGVTEPSAAIAALGITPVVVS